MSDVELNFKVASKQATTGLDKINRSVQQVGTQTSKTQLIMASLGSAAIQTGIRALANGFGNLVAIWSDGIKLAQIQEDAINSLNTAMKSTGTYTAEASQEMQDYASSLQQMTTFGDEAILQAQALGINMAKLSGEDLRDATLAAANMASALNLDLNTAMRMLAKSSTDGGSGLKRYGIEVEKGTTASDTLANAISKVNEQFDGAAAAKVNTFSGAMKQASNSYGDMQEELGFIITKSPVVVTLINDLSRLWVKLGTAVKDNAKEMQEWVDGSLTSVIKALKDSYKWVKDNSIKFEALAVGVGAAATAFGLYKIALNGAAIAQIALTVATKAFATAVAIATSPVTLVVGLVASLAAGGYYLATTWEKSSIAIELALSKVGMAFTLFGSIVLRSITPIEEGIRAFAAGILITFAQTFGTIIQSAIDMGSTFAGIFGVELPESMTKFQDNLLATAEGIVNATPITTEWADSIHQTTLNLDENITKLEAEKLALEKNSKAKDDISKKESIAAKKKIVTIEKDHLAHLKTTFSLDKKWITSTDEFNAQKDKDKIANQKATLGTIATLTSSNNQTLFRMGQAAAISQATIDGFAGVQKALASAPPPFNFVLAGLVGAAAALNVAKIAGTKRPEFADGGVVGGNSYSGDNVPALVNSGEMILNQGQQAQLFNQANGGGDNSALLGAINSLGDRIQNMELVIQTDDFEIGRSVNRSIDNGLILNT